MRKLVVLALSCLVKLHKSVQKNPTELDFLNPSFTHGSTDIHIISKENIDLHFSKIQSNFVPANYKIADSQFGYISTLTLPTIK